MSRDRTVARPYAKAAFELAQEQSTLAQWSETLVLLAAAASEPHLLSLMKDPAFTDEDQIDLFLSLGQGAFTAPMQAFIRLLGDFKRLSFLPQIAMMFEEMKAKAERVVVVELTSAFSLDAKEQEQLAAKLTQKMDCNIVLECATDRNIIGGAIIRAGDLVIDGSIRGKLEKLADSMGILN